MDGDEKVAALAGEAFSAITGLKMEGEYRQASEETGDALARALAFPVSISPRRFNGLMTQG